MGIFNRYTARFIPAAAALCTAAACGFGGLAVSASAPAAGGQTVLPVSGDAVSAESAGNTGNTAAGNAESTADAAGTDTGTDTVTFFAAGDVLMHGPVYKSCSRGKSGYDFSGIFSHMKDRISAADIAVLNQETVFVPAESGYTSYPSFGTPAELADAECAAGADVITQATNHAADRGGSAAAWTYAYWKKHCPGVTVLGIGTAEDPAQNAEYITRNGIKFALFNFTYGTNGIAVPASERWRTAVADPGGKWTAGIRKAAGNADAVIVFLHTGTEYMHVPSAYAQKQVRQAVAAGADIVICAHPHVTEPYGIYTDPDTGKSALVYWSLGNFVSGQIEPDRCLGGIAEFSVHKITEGKGSGTVYADSIKYSGCVTQQDSDGYTVYPLEDYTSALGKKHKLTQRGKTVSPAVLKKIFADSVSGAGKCGTVIPPEDGKFVFGN